MISMTLGEIAEIVGGEVHGDPGVTVTGPVEFDSRKVVPGGMFAAFVGATVDGHEFAANAVAAGAVAVLGSRPIDLTSPGREGPATPQAGPATPQTSPVAMRAEPATESGKLAEAFPGSVAALASDASVAVPTIVVADPRAAMGRLARAVIDRLPDLTVVAITGSSGKTSTKDMIAHLLAAAGPTVATAGSLNNELGVPYTALQATAQTRFLVLEMGARGPGHIRYLCDIAAPDVAVVVNVGSSHLEGFGSVDGIAKAKGELVEALSPDGVAVLNADDPRVRAMAARTGARVVLVGEAGDADVRAEAVAVGERGRFQYTMRRRDDAAAVRLALAGRHQVGNSLLAAAVAVELGLPLTEAAATLGELGVLSTRRMDVFDRTDGVTVIDDSYNANPASTSAALRALVAVAAGRRTVAVLASMAELGEYERAGHEEVGRLAAELGVDRLVVVGEQAAPIQDGAVTVASWGGDSVLVPDQEAAIALLRTHVRPGDVVLVKGSRYRTWDVADALREVSDK